MISSGPRAGFLGSTFASVKGFTFAFAICARATPGPTTWYVSYSCRASSSSSALAHPYLKLVEGEGDRAATVERIRQHRTGHLQCRERQRQDASERPRVDGHRGGREPPVGDHVGEQTARRMAHHGGPLVERAGGSPWRCGRQPASGSSLRRP